MCGSVNFKARGLHQDFEQKSFKKQQNMAEREREREREREGFEPFFPYRRAARIVQSIDRRKPNPRQASLGKTFSSYRCLHRTSDLRVSIAALANAVASESPSKTRPTR
jgi:hypothetical protein